VSGPAGDSKVAAVIVTHNSSSTIEATLQSVARLDLVEVVVVDNASTDDTVATVEAATPDGGRLVRQDNLGFGAGNNRGVRELRSDARLVLFLNPDAQIEPLDLTTLVDYLVKHPRVAMVGPRMRRGAEEMHSAGRDATVLTEIRTLLRDPVRRIFPDRQSRLGAQPSGAVGYVLGACMLVRRDALAEIGGFDERFFLFFEELDVGNRLRRAGWEVHHVAEASAHHELSASRRTLPGGAHEHYWASTWLYLRTWRGRRSAAVWAAAARATWWARHAGGRIDDVTYRRWRAALAEVKGRAS
jgi:N-acetylglucosaminyl-diphospho-decaprenol L-rhamnosyltransferase